MTTRVATASLPGGDSFQSLTANCNAGEQAVGGGYAVTGAFPDDSEVKVHVSHPSPATDGTTPTGWTVRYIIAGPAHQVSTYVVCGAP